MRKIVTLLLGALLFSIPQTEAQTPKVWTSSEISEAIKQLNVLGSALYIAAHPDDENTRMISYLSNAEHIHTTYLSLTRGDGGQNLIGPEIRELLGVIRTQELLAARRVDGGHQYFSRANDFGFSKHPDETLDIWNEEAVLSDVVWAIRKLQPDVIINRFDHRSAGRTHGHHTASAILSVEAFDLVGDSKAFPEQLDKVDTWQPRRLFFNTSWWFYGSREAFEKADKSMMVDINIGTYFPALGKSNTEIAAESRSMHKCQGMGRTATRGVETEFLELLKGDMPTEPNDLFHGINTTWTRLEGGAPIGDILASVEEEFQHDNPAASLPDLLEAQRLIQQLPDSRWKTIKNEEINQVIQACLAFFLEANAGDFSTTPGETVQVDIEATLRADFPVVLKRIELLPAGKDTTLDLTLPFNEPTEFSFQVAIPKQVDYTSPYWLTQPWDLGMYTVEEQDLRGLPETPRFLQVAFELELDGQPMRWVKDVAYKKTDAVAGEIYRPFEVLPPAFVTVAEPVYVFASTGPKKVQVKVTAGKDDIAGTVGIDLPKGWRLEPAQADFSLARKDADQWIEFELYPPAGQSEIELRPYVTLSDEKTYTQERVLIEYDHIPVQTILRESRAKAVKIDLQRAGERIAYIMGAGDEVPTSLEQIGYQVDILAADDVSLEKLKSYDALITGIRAYNTEARMEFIQPILLEYVKQGGTMIVQYNTTWRLDFPQEEIAPYPLELSRDRVTVEEAPITFLAPEHEVLNTPNKITQKDFEGWVQERGLYFPNGWDEDHFTAILACNDPGEDPKKGGLLVAPYGEGYYIYTGLSWFRELPAGVPGAYRLFTNLISIGKSPRP
jgi:LmbE family N-acetylglucosaminyl deacetylase